LDRRRAAGPLAGLARLVLTTACRASKAVGRVGWGIADQGLSSISNFAVGFVVLRMLGPEGLGLFTLAFTTYLIALNISRGLATDPLVVRFAGAETRDWRQATASSAGTALVVGALTGSACLVPRLLFPGVLGPELEAALAALGVSLPGLLVQDSWRYAFFAAGRGASAFLNDLVWVSAQGFIFMMLVRSNSREIAPLILAWGGAASAAALVGAIQARLLPRPGRCVRWVRHHRDLGLRYMAENLSLSAEVQLRAYGTTAIAGLEAVGLLRAAELILGPVTVVHFGLELVALPEAVRSLQDSVRRLRRLCVLLGTMLALSTLLWTVAALLVPSSVGSAVFGPAWPAAQSLLTPMGLWAGIAGLSAGATVGLRALAAARRSLRARLVSCALRSAGCFAGAAMAGVTGAAWGLVVTQVFATVFWWQQFQRACHERDLRPPPATIGAC
jgi:O-antigen/teichoic acid export membrane protein